MKYLFIVQGEGRGHLTQAMTLEMLLLERGHEVVQVLVGKSPQRQLPLFFKSGLKAPVKEFESMNFMPSADNKRPDMFKTVILNSFEFHRFIPSIQFIRDEIRASGADVVVNFYELMAGMTYFFHRIDVPMVCIGHQYLFLHKDFGLPKEKYPGSMALDFFSRLTSIGAVKHLALSFREMDADMDHNIYVVPPLLRREVLEAIPETGEYIHGYMLNSGFAEEIFQWHEANPDVELRFFWDKWDEGKIKVIDDKMTMYLIDDKEFINQMKGCWAYASTAGFESICEAMYLGKPVLMVPSHIEQEINGFDARRSNAGVVCNTFNLTELIKFARTFIPDARYKEWVQSASSVIINELENVC
ncbi:MAG: glycosyltransferase [Bacteroidales bacterium]|nr:glycosyltransferase [Bacteroidales bacterium]